MRRVALVPVFFAWVTFSCWAQGGPDAFAPTFDLFKFQSLQKEGKDPARSGGSRFAASVVLLHTPDVPVNAQAFSAASIGSDRNDASGDKIWASNGGWQLVTNADRPSLAPRLRFETGAGKLEVTPRRNSIRVEWQTQW